MKWYAMGHDFGNSEECDVLFVAKGIKKRRSFPTAFTRINLNEVNNLHNIGAPVPTIEPKKGKGKGKAVKVEAVLNEKDEAAQVVQFKDESIAWAIGDFAMIQGKQFWTGQGDHKRYATKHSVRGAIANAATWVSDKEFGLCIVTGLPADLFMRYADLRQQIKDGLDGVYAFTLDGINWRTCHVEIATVVMEGAGALIAYGASGGKMTRTGESAVIDIGGGTVDLFAQRGPVPIAEYCASDRLGVVAASRLLKDIFLRKHPDRGLTESETREIMYAFANGRAQDFPSVTVFGAAVSVDVLQDMVEEAVNSVADDIATFVASRWREADGGARFDPVLLVGGGYYYFFDAIQNRIPHIHVIGENDPLFPVFANAEGYAFLAARKLTDKLTAEAAKEDQEAQKAAISATITAETTEIGGQDAPIQNEIAPSVAER